MSHIPKKASVATFYNHFEGVKLSVMKLDDPKDESGLGAFVKKTLKDMK